MKIRHNPHGMWQRPSAVMSAEYEREVQRSTQRGERLYQQAQKRLEQAEAKLCRVRAKPGSKQHQITALEALVELRREELEMYRRMMEAVATNAQHRGRKSFRPVPPGAAS